MRISVALALVFIIMISMPIFGCSARMDQKIKESVDLGMDDMVKAKDMSQEMALISNISSDPALEYYFKKKHFTGSVSHGVATLTGKVRTQALMDQIVELAKMVEGIKEVNNELEIDPSIEETPFEW